MWMKWIVVQLFPKAFITYFSSHNRGIKNVQTIRNLTWIVGLERLSSYLSHKVRKRKTKTRTKILLHHSSSTFLKFSSSLLLEYGRNGSRKLARTDVWPKTYLNAFPQTLILTLKFKFKFIHISSVKYICKTLAHKTINTHAMGTAKEQMLTWSTATNEYV